MTTPRKRRIAAAAALATSLTAVFAALGGISVAQSAISAVQYQYGPKVTICHHGKTITVAKAAVSAHVRNHGDTVGRCTGATAKGKAKAKAKAEQAKAKHDEAKAKHDEAKAKHDEAKAEAEKPADEKPGNGKGRGRGK